MREINRYLFPLILNTTYRPTKSADGYVCFNSASVCQLAFLTVWYHALKELSESRCFEKNSRIRLKLITCIFDVHSFGIELIHGRSLQLDFSIAWRLRFVPNVPLDWL